LEVADWELGSGVAVAEEREAAATPEKTTASAKMRTASFMEGNSSKLGFGGREVSLCGYRVVRL
jgi:hypothetical protein